MSQPNDNGGTPSPELVALCETVYRKWWEDTPDGKSFTSIAHAYAIAFSKLERELAALRQSLAQANAELAKRDDFDRCSVSLLELSRKELAQVTAERDEALARVQVEQSCLKKELEKLAASEARAARMEEALREIASYDKDSRHGEGICPYGCDCPNIARTALLQPSAQKEPTP